jgi:hypothetical protein
MNARHDDESCGPGRRHCQTEQADPDSGQARPVTPLTKPASKNAAAMTPGWMIALGMPAQLAPGSNKPSVPLRNPAFAYNMGRMLIPRGLCRAF